jgi:hypothetical protein
MSENHPPNWKAPQKLAPVWRALIEVCFIVFLYYSNLLMGEYERSGQAGTRGFIWAVGDIFTKTNLAIAIATAITGHMVFEFLRKRL